MITMIEVFSMHVVEFMEGKCPHKDIVANYNWLEDKPVESMTTKWNCELLCV